MLCAAYYDKGRTELREIGGADELNGYITECVNKCFITDVSPLFIVSCENPDYKFLQKSIGYSVALAGADAVLAEGDAKNAYSRFDSLPADGIFILTSSARGIILESRLICGEKEKVFLARRFGKTGRIYRLGLAKEPKSAIFDL